MALRKDFSHGFSEQDVRDTATYVAEALYRVGGDPKKIYQASGVERYKLLQKMTKTEKQYFYALAGIPEYARETWMRSAMGKVARKHYPKGTTNYLEAYLKVVPKMSGGGRTAYGKGFVAMGATKPLKATKAEYRAIAKGKKPPSSVKGKVCPWCHKVHKSIRQIRDHARKIAVPRPVYRRYRRQRAPTKTTKKGYRIFVR